MIQEDRLDVTVVPFALDKYTISHDILKRHREYLRAFAEKYKDETALDMLKQV